MGKKERKRRHHTSPAFWGEHTLCAGQAGGGPAACLLWCSLPLPHKSSCQSQVVCLVPMPRWSTRNVSWGRVLVNTAFLLHLPGIVLPLRSAFLPLSPFFQLLYPSPCLFLSLPASLPFICRDLFTKQAFFSRASTIHHVCDILLRNVIIWAFPRSQWDPRRLDHHVHSNHDANQCDKISPIIISSFKNKLSTISSAHQGIKINNPFIEKICIISSEHWTC